MTQLTLDGECRDEDTGARLRRPVGPAGVELGDVVIFEHFLGAHEVRGGTHIVEHRGYPRYTVEHVSDCGVHFHTNAEGSGTEWKVEWENLSHWFECGVLVHTPGAWDVKCDECNEHGDPTEDVRSIPSRTGGWFVVTQNADDHLLVQPLAAPTITDGTTNDHILDSSTWSFVISRRSDKEGEVYGE